MDEHKLSPEQSATYRSLMADQDKAKAALALTQSRINVFFAELCVEFGIDPDGIVPDINGEEIVLRRLKRPQR